MPESTTARRPPEDEEWDIGSLLDEAGITDDPITEDEEPGDDGAPPEEDDLPGDEPSAETPPEVPGEAGSDVGSEPKDGPAGEQPAPGAEASTAPDGTTTTDNSPRPFSFKVDGEEVQPEGSFIVPSPDGEEMLVMPLRVFRDSLRPNYLGSRAAFQRTLRAKDIELEDLRTTRSAAEAEAQVLLDKLKMLTEDRGALTEFLANFEQDAPVLRAQAETAAARQEAENLRRGKMTPEQRIAAQEAEEREMSTGLKGWISNLSQRDEFKDVRLDVDGLYATLSNPALRETVFVRPDFDDPEMGVEKGKPAVNLAVVLTYLEREAALVRRHRTETGEAVTVARANGARLNGGPRKPIPPTGVVGDSPAPSPPAREEPKNRQEWLRSLERDD